MTLPRELAQRLDASRRLAPIPCGCRDPLHHRCGGGAAPSIRDVDGAGIAVAHLLETGLTPILGAPVARAMWARGDGLRRLAQQLHQLGGVTG